MKKDEFEEILNEFNRLKPLTLNDINIISSKTLVQLENEINTALQNNDLIEMSQKDILILKNYLHSKQNSICPLLNTSISLKDMALDHKHKLKALDASLDNGGLVRGAIEFRANALEGKIVNGWNRLFGSDISKHPISLPNFLRNLANYLENPPCPQVFIHPNEKTDKRVKASKNDYNKIVKYWKYIFYGKKIFSFPSSGYMTNDMRNALIKTNEFELNVLSGKYRKLTKSEILKIDLYYKDIFKNKSTPHIFIPDINDKKQMADGMYLTEEVKNILAKVNLLDLTNFVKNN